MEGEVTLDKGSLVARIIAAGNEQGTQLRDDGRGMAQRREPGTVYFTTRPGGGAGAPGFLDGVALGPNSAIAVVGDAADVLPPGASVRTLRRSRLDAWFFWHLATLARASRAVTGPEFLAALSASASGLDGVSPALIAADEYLPVEDFLFRFDRGAFWMARPGLALFYGSAAWRDEPAPISGPSWWIRGKYAWIATTRRLYDMLHSIGNDLLARSYVIQDFVMPSATAAAALVARTASPDLAIWPLWLCPVRAMEAAASAAPGFGFPVSTTRPGDMWFNVGVYGVPAGGAPFDPLALNTSLEDAATHLGGRKMLYAQSFYTPEGFWSLFRRDAYDALRTAYAGGASVFPDIATKLLLPPATRASLTGVKPVSLLAAWRPLAAWYATIWAELLLPRALHAALGLRHTGMTTYASASATAAAAAPPSPRPAPAATSPSAAAGHGVFSSAAAIAAAARVVGDDSITARCSRRNRTVTRETK